MASLLGREHPTTEKAKIHPTLRDLAWAAGFIEGEGCIIRTCKVGLGSEKINAVQKTPEPLERLQAMFGGAIKPKPGGAFKPESPCFVWEACGPRARGIMLTLYPMMTARRQEQIRKALGPKRTTQLAMEY